MYSTKAIANYFIDRGHREGVDIDPMKLQKLVYFAHGWHLAIREEPLVNERAEAWRYGPVFPRLYQEFKDYGRNPIRRRAKAKKMEGTKIWQWEPLLRSEDIDTRQVLDEVWEVYSGCSGYELSVMTHQKDGPWAETWLNEAQGGRIINVDIPDRKIQEYFRRVGLENG